MAGGRSATGDGGFEAAADTGGLALISDLLNPGDAQIVDARSPGRFAGTEPEPRPGIAPGHIPGSRNLPQGKLFAADGTWKRGEDLRAAFADAGVDIAPAVTVSGWLRPFSRKNLSFMSVNGSGLNVMPTKWKFGSKPWIWIGYSTSYAVEPSPSPDD